jgi:hypothetical protein
MYVNQFRILLVTLFITAGILYSCHEEETVIKGFEITLLKKQESDSTYTIRISTGKVTSAVTITINISGSAIPGADFTFDLPATSSSSNGIGIISSSSSSTSSTNDKELTVGSGESYAELTFKIIDDKFVEPGNETIFFQITGISDATIDNALQNRICKVILTDNDTPPIDAMQVDLSWNVSDGSLFNTSNFDMYLVNNVVISNSKVVSKEMISSVYSTNKTSLESFTMDNSLADDTYYVLIRFVSGTADSAIEIIASEGDMYSRAAGTIGVVDVGKDFYYGPITKTGNSYSGRQLSPSFLRSD